MCVLGMPSGPCHSNTSFRSWPHTLQKTGLDNSWTLPKAQGISSDQWCHRVPLRKHIVLGMFVTSFIRNTNTLVKVFLVLKKPQPKLCCVTTHLSVMCEVLLKRLSTSFTLNHLCSHCRFRPPSKLLSSQPSHKSLPPCHVPSALHGPLVPGILLVLTDRKIWHCAHEWHIDTRLQENYL